MTAIRIAWKMVFVMGIMAALAGCTSSTVVPLRYQASASSGQTCPQPITLLPFADKRADTLTIGSLGEGKHFYAENDVSEWVSWAMFEELKARGCEVKYREKADTSVPKGYSVSGSFDMVDVQRGENLMVKAKLRLRVKVEKDGNFIIEQIYTGERERLGMTAVSAAQEVLSNTLQYLMQDAATDVVRATK